MSLKLLYPAILKPSILILLISVCFSDLYSQITADFSSTSIKGCAPLVVQLTDNSLGSPSEWEWDFGNGNKAITQNPSAIYSKPGIYTISLKISKNGLSDIKTKTAYITVFSSPKASFSTAGGSSGCAPFDVNFLDNSSAGSPPSAPINKWLWSFGDGNSSISKNTSHQFKTADKFTITLQVTDTNGCKNTYFVTNYIETTKPKADFSANPTSSCSLPANINFTNNSRGNKLNYNWNFGDGASSVSENPSHDFKENGTYSPELIITDENNCKDSLRIKDYINIKNIKADFIANKKNLCQDDTVIFDDLTLGATNWSWNFGDGSPESKTKNTFHKFTQPGTYTVTLLVGNGLCTDQLIKTEYIQVDRLPNADFSTEKDSSCSIPFEVIFNNLSTDASSYNWNYGDLKFSSDQNINHKHTYDSIGNFNVTLTATSAAGCSSILTKSNLIKISPPKAFFSTNTLAGCIPLPVNFDGSLSTSNENINKWEWDFGDGSTDNSAIKANHTYNAEGEYDVKLTIITSSNCKHLYSTKILAGNKPTADFSFIPNSHCIDSVFTFTDNSLGMTGNSKNWLWDFEKTSSFGQIANVTFKDTGIFDVRLISVNNGCSDTLILKDTIKVLGPKALFNYTQSCRSLGFDPFTVTFKDSSIMGTSWTWDFGDFNSFNGKNPSHTFDSTKTYQVTLTVSDSITGCVNNTTQAISITDPIAGFYSDTTVGCYPFSPIITDTSKNAANYLWNFGNGNSSVSNKPEITYSDTGFYNLSLIIGDEKGCKDTINIDSLFHAIGPKPDFEANNLSGCRPLPVSFSDKTYSDTTLIKWLWDFGDSMLDSIANPTHIYVERGSYPVKLSVTDTNHCSATKIISNFIEPTFPFPSFSVSDTITCKNKEFTIKNSSTGKNLKYLWDFGDGITGDTAAINFTYKYETSGSYDISLKLTDINGCDSTLKIPALVKIENPVADFSPSATLASCPPFAVSFSNKSSGIENGKPSYEWNFGDNTILSDLTDPLHFYNIPGNYTLRLSLTTANGCKDDTIAPGLISLNGPSGSFKADTTKGCRPFKVNYDATASNTAKYIWDFGNGDVQISNSSNIKYIYTNGGIFTPTLILDDGLGCNFSVPSPFGSITVNYTQYTLSADTKSLCRGDSTKLGATSLNAGTTYTWSSNSIPNCLNCNTIVAKPDSTTTYFVDISDNNCPERDSITILVHQLPVISISKDSSVCSGNSIMLKANGGIKYLWHPASGLECDTCSQTIARPEITSNYSVEIKDSFCLAKDSVLITVRPSAIAKFTTEPTEGIIPLKVNFINQSTFTDSVYWFFGNGRKSSELNPSYTYKDTGTFKIMLIANNNFGCPDSTDFTIPVGVISSLKVPNVFTPNEDGKNDFFTINNTAIGIQEFEGTIFNRWGDAIATWKDAKTGWNGRTNSDVTAPEGTYFYVITAKGLDGIPYKLQGYVSLIR